MRIVALVWKIKRLVYHGGMFDGADCRCSAMLPRCSTTLKNTIKHTSKKADEAEIRGVHDLIKRVLQQFDIAYSKLRLKYGEPTDRRTEALLIEQSKPNQQPRVDPH